jgi:hypothetical protein
MQIAGTHIAALAVGVGLGIGAVAVADSPTANQSATNADVVRQLKKTNAKLDVVNRTLGGSTTAAPDGPAIQPSLRQICRGTTGVDC